MIDDRGLGAGRIAAANAFAASLPAQWRDRPRFVVLDEGFDGGRRFHAIREAWHRDPQRCAQLQVITVSTDIANGPSTSPWADDLAAVWPPITPNLHRLAFDGGQVQWLLSPTTLSSALRELVAEVDAFGLTDRAAPGDAHDAPRRGKALARLAHVGSMVFVDAATAAIGEAMQQTLRSGGFQRVAESGAVGGTAGRLWRYAPAFTPRHASPRRGHASTSSTPVLVVGAGLAGCAMAWALAEQGRDSIVFERHGAVASETSGNVAGLFHGIVNPQDGAHARFNRAAALETHRAVSFALGQHGVPGSTRGLLRVDTAHGDHALHGMLATLQRLGLPVGYVQALSAADASAQAGLTLNHPAWWYPGGGWVQPGGLARSFLARAGDRCTLRTGIAIDALTRSPRGWQLRDAAGAVVAESETVVLANAGDALRLLRPWLSADTAPIGGSGDFWPLQKVRGQISIAASADLPALVMPQVPIAGSGYLLPSIDGQVVFGATAQPADDDAEVRDSDHAHNLAQLSRLIGVELRADVTRFAGRTGWRWSTDDRLPVLGAVPDLLAAARVDRLEHPGQVPRLPGLYACTALGSRGITWAALSAQVVAASITGAVMPIEAGLLANVDAARFVVRTAARRSRGAGLQGVG